MRIILVDKPKAYISTMIPNKIENTTYLKLILSNLHLFS